MNLHTSIISDSHLLLSLQRFYSRFTSFCCFIFNVSSEKHQSGSEENNFLSPLEHQNIWRFWGHFNNRHQYSPPRSDRRRAGRRLQAQAQRSRLMPHVILALEPRSFQSLVVYSCEKNALRRFMQSRRSTQRNTHTHRNTSVSFILCVQILYLQRVHV